MTRLVRAELLKVRRRWASYIVLGILLGLMALVYLLVGLLATGPGRAAGGFITSFPNAYGVINQFVFGLLGSLLAVAYAAAIAGADWNWGVVRVIIARGASRSGYVLAKALGIGIALLVGMLIAFSVGIVLTLMAASMLGTSTGDPFSARSMEGLVESLALGSLVLLQRGAIGFAVAMLLRSQLAGVVVGIVLFIGEGILSAILFALTFSGRFTGGGFDTQGTQWYQFLPFSIGDSVLSFAPSPADMGELPLTPVPLDVALIAVVAYLVGCVVVAMAVMERSEVAA